MCLQILDNNQNINNFKELLCFLVDTNVGNTTIKSLVRVSDLLMALGLESMVYSHVLGMAVVEFECCLKASGI